SAWRSSGNWPPAGRRRSTPACRVIALIVGSVDTRMAAHVQGRKEDPRDIARAGLTALDRGEYVADTDFMAVDARARYARDPVRYERGMTKLLHATVMDTGR